MFSPIEANKSERLYLDWAAATPLSKRAGEAMASYFACNFGNPGAIHAEGRAAQAAVADARADVARVLKVRPDAVAFTSGGTESNNIAILGAITAELKRGRVYRELSVVATRLEHPSVMQVLIELEQKGVDVRYAAVDAEGVIRVEDVKKLVDDTTALFICSYVNSEIGVIQPIGRLVRAIRQKVGKRTLIHLDAAQAPLWLPCDLNRVPVDLLALDAGKFCGPKGVGMLAGRSVTNLSALTYGGGQEAGIRPGTENVPGIVGTAVAFADAQGNHEAHSDTVSTARDEFIASLENSPLTCVLNGPKGEQRVANNINISIPSLDTEYAVVVLDHHGIAASTKSACSGAGGGDSQVVKAISDDAARAAATLRFTLGPDVAPKSLTRVVTVLKNHVAQMANVSPVAK